MATNYSPEECLKIIRAQRSSEANAKSLLALLHKAAAAAKQNGNSKLAIALAETENKYAAEYDKAKETTSSAWPEFENFVTHFERALTEANAAQA